MSSWILYWKDGSSEIIKGDKFYKTFLENYKVHDLGRLQDYGYNYEAK